MAFDYTNYYELDYIESTGTQYIDTGLNSADGYEYEISGRFTQLSTSAYNGLVGRTQSNRHDYFNVRTNAIAYCGIGSPETQITTMVAGTDYIIKWRSLADNRYCSVNDTSVSISGTNTVSTNNAYLFCYNHISSGASAFSSFRLYYFDVQDANGYVRKFRPAQRKSDGVFGLYDTVNEIFYTNAGTGTFRGFDKVNYSELEYVESTGTQYIDLGSTTTNMQIDIECSPTTEGYAGDDLIGIGSNSVSRYRVEVYLNDSNLMRMYVGTNGSDGSGVSTVNTFAPNQRLSVTYRQASSAQTLTVNGETITRSKSISTSSHLYISHYVGSSSTYGKYRFYSVKVYKSGTIAFDLVPALRKSDKVAGFYDLRNGAFYPSEGSEDFVYSLTSCWVKVNGAWKKGTPYIKVNGTWENGTPYIKVNGEWR